MLRYGYKFGKTEFGGDEIMRDYAVLTSNGNFTIFEYDNEKIRFATSKRLEKYTKVVEWDHGYLVVMAKYQGLDEVEEYIDLIPKLENLYYDVDNFLKPIKEVRIEYAAWYSTGMRVGEMVLLNRNDIDFNEREGIVLVRVAKNE